MKLYRFLAALLLAALLAGCAPVDSVNPLYNNMDVVFDPALLGQWGQESDGLNFARLGDNSYRVVMSGKDDETGQITTAVFDAHLVQLGSHRFLDVVWREFPSGSGEETIPEIRLTQTKDGLKVEPRLIHAGMGVYLELLRGEFDGEGDRFGLQQHQAHQFFKVVMEDQGQTLELVQLDDGWVERQIRSGNLAIDHEEDDTGSIVLTASTPELQRMVLDHVNDEEAFSGETIVHRPARDAALP